MPDIRDLYMTRQYLYYGEMRDVLKRTMNSPEEPIVISDKDKFIEKNLGKSLRKKVSICLQRWKLSVKLFFNKGYKRKFRGAATAINLAYFNQFVKKSSEYRSSEHIPSDPKPTVDPIKELEERMAGILKQKEPLLAKIAANKKEQEALDAIEFKHKDGTKLDAKNLVLGELQSSLDVMEEHKKDIEKYDPKAPKGWSEVIYGSPIKKQIKTYNPDFAFHNLAQEKEKLSEKITACSDKIVKVKAKIIKLEGKVQEEIKASADNQKKSDQLSEEIVQLRQEVKGLGLQEEQLNQDLCVLKNLPPPPPKIKEQKYKYITPKENLKYVLDRMSESVDLSDADEETRKSLKKSLEGYLKRSTQTPKLVMSGIKDANVAKQKCALLVRILGRALTETENNEKLCHAVSEFLDSLLSLEKTIKQEDRGKMIQLVTFVFGIDPVSKKPRMDEAYRFRAVTCLLGVALIMSQYFFDVDSLKPDEKKIKSGLESRFGLIRWGAELCAHVIFYFKRDVFVRAIKDIPVIQGNPEYQKLVDGLVEVLVPVILKILGGDPKNPTEEKKKIHKATENFAQNDFKKFIDLLKFEKLPTTTEATDLVSECFGVFSKTLNE